MPFILVIIVADISQRKGKARDTEEPRILEHAHKSADLFKSKPKL